MNSYFYVKYTTVGSAMAAAQLRSEQFASVEAAQFRWDELKRQERIGSWPLITVKSPRPHRDGDDWTGPSTLARQIHTQFAPELAPVTPRRLNDDK